MEREVIDRLILVRHGRTHGNRDRRFLSSTDLPLDEVGEAQARRLGRELHGFELSRVLCSPMRRARRTAELIIEDSGAFVSVEIDDRLVEVGMGAFEGRTAEEIESLGLTSIFRSWRQGQPVLYPDGAESFEQAAERAIDAFQNVSARDGVGTVLVVGHSHLLRILITVAVLGGNPVDHRRLRIENGAAAVVEWELGIPRLVGLNSVPLPMGVSGSLDGGTRENG